MTTNNTNMTNQELQDAIAAMVAKTFVALTQPAPAQEAPKAEAPVKKPSVFAKAKGYLREAAFHGNDAVRLAGVSTNKGLHWAADRIKDAGNLVETGTTFVADLSDTALDRTDDEAITFMRKMADKYSLAPVTLKTSAEKKAEAQGARLI